MGDELEVKILRVDSEDRKIGLSRKRVEWAEEDEAAAAEAEAAGRESLGELKGGIGSDSGPLFKSAAVPETAAVEADAPAETEANSQAGPSDDASAAAPPAAEELAAEEQPADNGRDGGCDDRSTSVAHLTDGRRDGHHGNDGRRLHRCVFVFFNFLVRVHIQCGSAEHPLD